MWFAAAFLLAASACQAPREADNGWQDAAVTAVAASPSPVGVGEKIGELTFRGGLQLSSPNALFGGWSGVEVDDNGALIAVSDTGMWLSANLVTDEKTGALIGLADARMAMMRDTRGDPLDGKINQDAEGLAKLDDGRYAVSFERNHRILIYDLDAKGPTAPAQIGPEIPTKTLGENEGIEGLAPGPDAGEVLGLAEAARQFFRFKIGVAEAPVSGAAQVSSNYALVGLDRLPDGDYIAMERFYFPIIGFRSAIRRYAAAGLNATPPALSGPVLAQLASPLLTDNFESIAAVALKDGGVRLYILSDNNFAADQKTLIYAFDLPAPPAPSPPEEAPKP